MDLRINSPQIAPLSSSNGSVARRTADASTGNEGFSTAFKDALQSISEAQNRASGLQREVQLENPAVSLEETMVSMQKAQVGFQAALHVRNRLVQAYTDIMNMQV